MATSASTAPGEAWFHVRVTECKEQTFAYMYMAMEGRQAETDTIRGHVRAARAAALRGTRRAPPTPGARNANTMTFTECLTELEELGEGAVRSWREVPDKQRYGTFHVVTWDDASAVYTVSERTGSLRFAHIDEEIDSMF